MPESKIKITGDNKDFLAKLSDAKKKLGQTFQGIQAGPLGGLLSAGIWGTVATGVLAVARSFTNMLDEMNQMRASAAALGVTVEQFAKLQMAANVAGVEMSSVVSVVSKLNNLQREAAIGNEQAARSLAAVGLEWQNMEGMTDAQKLLQVRAALDGITDQYQRAAVARALFGEQGLQAIEEAQAINAANAQVSEHAIQATKDLAAGWQLVKESITVAWKEAMAFVASIDPALQSLLILGQLRGAMGKQAIEGAQPGNKAAQEDIIKNAIKGTTSAVAAPVAPVDQLRRIGAFDPRQTAAQQSALDAAMRWLPEIVELLKKQDPDIKQKGKF